MALPDEERRHDRLVGLCVAGVALLDPPLLTLFSGAAWRGWPLIYVYVFVVWAALIGAVAAIAERRRRGARPVVED